MERHATSTWKGTLQNGAGMISTQSGALTNQTVSPAVMQNESATSSPEELIAAAHAACYSMALARALSKAGYIPEYVTTRAVLAVSGHDDPRITSIHLETEGKVPGMDESVFLQTAEYTRRTCPVSMLLTPGLEGVMLGARLVE